MSKGILSWKKDEQIKGKSVIDDFDSGLDIAQHMAIVHSNIKSTVSPDFVMAKFDEKNKEFVIEMVANAYFARNLLRSLEIIGEKRLLNYKRLRPNDTGMIEKLELELRLVKDTQDIIFTTFTTKVQMVAIVNRNVSKNYLLKLLAGFSKQMEDEEVVDDGITGLEKLKTYMKEKLGPESDAA